MHREIDEAEKVLMRWADWMRVGGAEVRGYPEKAPGFQHVWVRDNEELTDAADEYEMGKANAAIDSLSQPHQQIIYKRHGIGYKIWRFADEEGLYLAAKDAFWVKYSGR